jgi:acetoacetyl-CoA synthetase
VNFAGEVLKGSDLDEVAMLSASRTKGITEISLGTLRQEVSATGRWLRQLRVGSGDLIVGALPNCPEAVTGFLAAAALGAVWSDCSPTLDAEGVVRRYADLVPRVLIGVDSVRQGERTLYRRAEIDRLRSWLPGLLGSAVVPGGSSGVGGWPGGNRSEFVELDFDHPLALQLDRPVDGGQWPPTVRHGTALSACRGALRRRAAGQDRVLWATARPQSELPLVVSAILPGRTLVLYEGEAEPPTPTALWKLCAETAATTLVVDANFLGSSSAAGLNPTAAGDLDALEAVVCVGPAPDAAAAGWLRERLSLQVATLGRVGRAPEKTPGLSPIARR